ncbi:MAG: UDP-N-acetylmuramoyl-L-alanine--D-glutamate ligase [Acidobacteriota bacterium]
MSFSVAGQEVVVVGGARSGVAAAELLYERGAHVTLTDSRTDAFEGADHLRDLGVDVELGPHRESLLLEADLVVLSPGVPPDQPALQAARRKGVPVIGEIELASRWLTGRVVAITGTKGKSTTTTLTARMLAAGGLDVTAGGNLGTPLSTQVAASRVEAIHVVEVSSFQLETTDRFHPWISVLVNLSPDHLDRHATFDEYAGAKARIFANQTPDDWAVINADDPASLALARGIRAQRFDFALQAAVPNGITVQDGTIVERGATGSTELMPVSAVKLPGRHLLADVLAASAVARLAGVAPAAIRTAVESFEGLEHALQRVVEIGGVEFVNDSKATNVVSARRAIESLGQGVVPIMGGRYKGGDFADLHEVLRAHATAVVAIGEAADRIETAVKDVVPVARAGSMRDAVRRAFGLATPGGTVVLAPACSSFDMFTDYAARGRAFVDEVKALAAEHTRTAAGKDGAAAVGRQRKG